MAGVSTRAPRAAGAYRAALAALALALPACGSQGAAPAETGQRVPPVLQFEGYVYVEPQMSEFKIVERVRTSTLSVFPGLRRAHIMASRREVRDADAQSFKEEPVTVVDARSGARTRSLRVRYRYLVQPDVAPDLTDRMEIPAAVLQRDQDIDTDRVLRECTANTPEDREYSSSLAFVFDPTLEGCKAAMRAEEEAIDAARAALPGGASAGDSLIPIEERDRLYLPVTAVLEARALEPGEVAPSYVPFKPEVAAAARAKHAGEEDDPTIGPAQVIFDPDAPNPDVPHEPGGEAARQGAPLGGQGQPEAQNPNLPQVVGVPQAAEQQRKREVQNERFDFSFEQLLDVKFIAVWVSLLMLYPILRGEKKKEE